MIEHIPFASGQAMLRECHRVLKPGGVLRIVTPSLGFLLRVMSPDRNYFEQAYLEWSLKAFVPEAREPTNAFFLNNFMRNWGHTFIYDHQTLRLALTQAGFAAIAECPISQSTHADLCDLESVNRLPPGYLALESMVYEATR